MHSAHQFCYLYDVTNNTRSFMEYINLFVHGQRATSRLHDLEIVVCKKMWSKWFWLSFRITKDWRLKFWCSWIDYRTFFETKKPNNMLILIENKKIGLKKITCTKMSMKPIEKYFLRHKSLESVHFSFEYRRIILKKNRKWFGQKFNFLAVYRHFDYIFCIQQSLNPSTTVRI